MARGQIKWERLLEFIENKYGHYPNCKNLKRKYTSRVAVVIFVAVIASIYGWLVVTNVGNGNKVSSPPQLQHTQRHLLSSASSLNATKVASHGPEWEKCDFENAHTPAAWVFFHTITIIISFIALAVICDDFFVPSLEVISEKMRLSKDVAGATFMAAGSSAPELFTSFAGVAVETDVGVGTIVGSAVFNLLIIIAMTAVLSGKVLLLDWRPLLRDSFFYFLSILLFIVFSWDAKIDHWEAAVLLFLYILYIAIMVVNENLMNWMAKWKFCCKSVEIEPSRVDMANGLDSVEMTTMVEIPRRMSLVGGHSIARRLSLQSANTIERTTSMKSLKTQKSIENATTNNLPPSNISVINEQPEIINKGVIENGVKKTHNLNNNNNNNNNMDTISNKQFEKKDETDKKELEEEEEEEKATMKLCPCNCCPLVLTSPPTNAQAKEKGGCLEWSKLLFVWLLWLAAFPFFILFSWTIPNCAKPHLKKYFMLSFLISVAWIAILTFAMVTLVGRTGCILNIDNYVMGLVIVAIGTSVPDTLSSIIVGRAGFGDMAVSNAIGSNVFDINMGLGLPFVIRIAIDKGKSIKLIQSESEWNDYYDGTMSIVPHAKFGFLLILILALALSILSATKFKLNKWIGISFVVLYVIFVAYAFFQELVCTKKWNVYC